MELLNLIIFASSLAILVASGSIMVKSLSKIASYIHMSEYTIGFIILAFGTSIPELFIGISSAINKTSGLIMGTVIGSNIANLTIIIGIPILMGKGLVIHSKKTKNDALWMISLAMLPLVLKFIGGKISQIDGVILLLAFGLYMYKLIREGKEFSKQLKEGISHKMIVLYVLLFVFSLYLLYLSSEFVVEYATLLALDLNIFPIMIGLFLIAIGTSLPELVAGISAVVHGHDEMSIGNIIGSVIANSTLVLGVSAMIYPINSSFIPYMISSIFMFLVAIIFTAFVEKGDRLTWLEGLSLVFLYIFFLIVQFYTTGVAL